SASMGASDAPEGKTRLEQAKLGAIDHVDRLPSGTQVMVITAAARAETAIAFTRDHGAVKTAVRAIDQTDQPGDLSRAMRVVRALAGSGSEDGDDALPVLYIYTDGADAPAGGIEAPVPETFVRIERQGGSVGAGVDNAGIGAIAARRDFEDPALVRLFCRVVSARSEPSEVAVRLSLDGEPVEAKTVTVPARAAGGEPGEAPVSFELRDSDGALAVVSVAGGDAFPADDSAGVVLAPPAGARVAVVQPGVNPTENETLLLDALRAVGADSIERLTPEAYALRAGDPAFFANTDMIVLDGVTPDETPPVPTLTFRDAGDGPLTRQRFAYWSRSHPLMRDIGLNGVIVNAPPDFRPVRREGQRVEEIAAGPSSTLIAAIESEGVRRCLVAFRLRDASWKDESLPLFIANALDWLTSASAREAATSADTRTPASLFDASIVGGTRVTLTGPDGAERTGVGEPSGRVVFGVVPRAGVYTARTPGGTRPIAINLVDARESALVTRDLPVVGGQVRPAQSGEGPPGTVEVWRWFILAALAILVIEFLLYARKMRL
ncbi:MAG: VWA domain-containing protein, partial [Planctomycetota bacterium]